MNHKLLSIFFLSAGLTGSALAEPATVTLDLTSPIEPMEYDAETGAWTETFNDDIYTVDSQLFSFIKYSFSNYMTWCGFTASNSADSSRRDDTFTYQYSNMAEGGIMLDEEGNILRDEFGAPVVSSSVPYLVGYVAEFLSINPTVVFNDGLDHQPIGLYLNNNSYPYYAIEYGDAFSRAFTNGDRFKVIITAIASDESRQTMEVDLASSENGDLTINRGWKYVDLTSLAPCNQIEFGMSSTDSSAWGSNTPTYFCLDKLTVEKESASGVNELTTGLLPRYDRLSATLHTGISGMAVVYDGAGNKIAVIDNDSADLSRFDKGIYVARNAAGSIKFVK